MPHKRSEVHMTFGVAVGMKLATSFETIACDSLQMRRHVQSIETGTDRVTKVKDRSASAWDGRSLILTWTCLIDRGRRSYTMRRISGGSSRKGKASVDMLHS